MLAIRFLHLGFALALALSAGAAAAQAPVFSALRSIDERVLTIGHRLAVGAVALCRERQWQHGLAVHDLSQYPRSARREVGPAFNLADGPAVLALAAGGPAERAGLRRDDAILAADAAPLPRAPSDVDNSFAPTERIIEALERAFADGQAVLTVRRGGTRLDVTVAAELGCASRFQVIPSSRINAKADGRYVQVTSGIAQLAASDDEMAALIAHELAHNILRHRERLNAAGIDRGLLQGFGRNARLTRETEVEADRFAVYLMDRAGFDIRGIVRWWRRLGPRTASLFGGGTHPAWRQRIATMETEIAAIEAARREGRMAVPPFTA
jgi:beta-barrel assembly-enhancing protease